MRDDKRVSMRERASLSITTTAILKSMRILILLSTVKALLVRLEYKLILSIFTSPNSVSGVAYCPLKAAVWQ